MYRTYVVGAAVAALVIVAAGAAWAVSRSGQPSETPAAKSVAACCAEGRSCCDANLACCSSGVDCCDLNLACCTAGESCCTAAHRAPATKVAHGNCCFPGADCCEANLACCSGADCCAAGLACCDGPSACCTAARKAK